MNRIPIFCLCAVLGLASAISPVGAFASGAEVSAGVYPHYEVTTAEAYDLSGIKIYTGEHEAIYAHIDENRDAHLENLQRWVRQPSISAQSVGITEMAELLRDDLAAIGFSETRLVPTSGHPGLWSFYDAGALLVQAAMGVFDKWATIEDVMPRMGGSAPFYQFTERLGLPLVFNELGNGTGAHGPNEYILIHPAEGSKVAGLADIEKSYVDLLFALAESAAAVK